MRTEMCYTGDRVLEVEVKLLEGGEERGRKDPPPPVCQAPGDEAPLDARLLRLLIFLFRVQRLHNPPAQCRMDMEITQGGVEGARGDVATVIWDTRGEEGQLWRRRGQNREHIVVVTRRCPPEDLRWVKISRQGVAAFRYMVACKHHDCGGPPNKEDIYIAVLQGGPLRHEVDEALGVFLEENFTGAHEYTPQPGPRLPPNILYPHTEPGLHFHDLPELATVRGRILGVDAGTARAGEEGRPPMSAAGYAAGATGEGEASVAGGPGTSQKGEALALIEYVIALARRGGVYWIIGDSEAAVGALRKYQEGVKAGDGMREFYA